MVVRDSRESGLPTSVPSPDDNQTALLFDRLAAIDPRLGQPTDYGVNRVRNVCQSLQSYPSGPPDPDGAAQFFTLLAAADGVDVTSEQSQQVVAAIAMTLCPT